MSLWLKRELLGIGTLRCFFHTLRRKRLTHALARAGRFLNARIATFAKRRRFRVHRLNICQMRSKSTAAWGDRIQSKGSNFGVQLQWSISPGAPKLAALAVAIESERFEFDRFLPLKNQKRRDAVKRHLVTFPATFKNIKERDAVKRDFLGKKVTALIKKR
jgi:hypothetical protein